MLEPFYQGEGITLYNADCSTPEAIDIWTKADVLCTDPPYGVAYVSNASKWNGPSDVIVGDDNADHRDAMLGAWRAVKGDDAPVIMFGSWKIDRPHNTRHRLIWDKGDSPGMGDLTLPWGPGDEEIYVMGTGFKGKRRSNVIRAQGYSAGSAARPNHPTPKPVALMEALIDYCPPGVIADPYSGSGSTLVAARNLGRQAIGFEIDPRYCTIIASRLAQMVFAFDDEPQVRLDGTTD